MKATADFLRKKIGQRMKFVYYDGQDSNGSEKRAYARGILVDVLDDQVVLKSDKTGEQIAISLKDVRMWKDKETAYGAVSGGGHSD